MPTSATHETTEHTPTDHESGEPQLPTAQSAPSSSPADCTPSANHAPQGSPPQPSSPAKSPVQTHYYASIYPGHLTRLPPDFAEVVRDLEANLSMPVWLLVQNYDRAARGWTSIEHVLFKGFQARRNDIPSDAPVAILVESMGGLAEYAYRIARLFQRRASEITIIVPQCAKSAATLLALAGDQLYLGRDAELGPLDVQILDPDIEEFRSGLDAVQAFERLNAFGLTMMDQVMPMLLKRTGKKIDSILPHVLDYVGTFLRPLLENVDAVDYTNKTRTLKVGEEYATRLLQDHTSPDKARAIARHLVERYPDHSFVIDCKESQEIGLNIAEPSADLSRIMDRLLPYMDDHTFIGTVVEDKP